MWSQRCVHSVTILVSLLAVVAAGVPNVGGQLDQSIPAPGSKALTYARPPVQFLDRNAPSHGGNTERNQLRPSTFDNAVNVAKAVPYSKIVPYPIVSEGQEDPRIFGGPLYSNGVGGSGSEFQRNAIPIRGTQSKEFPTLNAPQISPVNNKDFNNEQIVGSRNGDAFPNFNQGSPAFPSNPKSPLGSKSFNQQIIDSQSGERFPSFTQQSPVLPSNPKSPVGSKNFNQQIIDSQNGERFSDFNRQSPVLPSNTPVSNQNFNQQIPATKIGNAFTKFNQQPAVFPTNLKSVDPANVSPSNSKQKNLFDTSSFEQIANAGQQFKIPASNDFFNPLNLLQQNTLSKGQGQESKNYIPILAKGFSVPTTFTNGQASSKPAQGDTLFSVANPSQDKREIIGTYMPRNDFVNPQLFAIPDEDKHNIVNRIFGGFQAPMGDNSRFPNENRPPLVSPPVKSSSDFNFFNRRGESQAPRNVQPHGQPSGNPLGGSFGIYNRNDNQGPINPPQTNTPLKPTNSKASPVTSLSPIGSISLPKQNNFDFSGGLNNPGAFPNTGTAGLKTQGNNFIPSQRDAPLNINKNKEQSNVLNVNQSPFQKNGLLINTQAPQGNNKRPFGNNNANSNLNFGKGVQQNVPSQFSSIPSFEDADLFRNAPSGFGSFPEAFDKSTSANGDGSAFIDQQPPVLLFSDFSQRDPLTVDKFRSKNLMKDDSFGQTDYDRNRPTSLNILGNQNDFFAGGNVYGGNALGAKSGNTNFGANSGFAQSGSKNFGANSGFAQSGSKNFDGNAGLTQSDYKNAGANLGLFQKGSNNFGANLGLTQTGNNNFDANSGITQSGSKNFGANLGQAQKGKNNFGADSRLTQSSDTNLGANSGPAQSSNTNFGTTSGLGGFQQIGGSAVTTGNSYDNVNSQSQGFNKNFEDNSNLARSQPSSFTKQGGFSNAFQQNDAFNNAGKFSDGNDYANQFNFKDGGSTGNQRASDSHNQRSFRNTFEDSQQADDQKSFSNADGYNNAAVNGRKFDLTDGYTDNVNYNNQNSDSSHQRFNDLDGYQRGVANVGVALTDNRGDLYANLPSSVNNGLPQESSYKPFDVNKPVFGGVVLSS